MIKVLKEKTVFDNGLVIRKGKITRGERTFTRFCLKREDAAAILIYNKDSKMYIVTGQFRYPVAQKIKGNLIEIVAGKLEGKEKALNAAIREIKEETGYKVKRKNIRFLFSCFSSPGYSSERFHIYYAIVTNKDKVTAGGGNESENEYITIKEIDAKKFKKLILDGSIQDAKTYLAGMHLMLHNQLE